MASTGASASVSGTIAMKRPIIQHRVGAPCRTSQRQGRQVGRNAGQLHPELHPLGRTARARHQIAQPCRGQSPARSHQESLWRRAARRHRVRTPAVPLHLAVRAISSAPSARASTMLAATKRSFRAASRSKPRNRGEPSSRSRVAPSLNGRRSRRRSAPGRRRHPAARNRRGRAAAPGAAPGQRAADIRHPRRHDRHQLDIRLERQAGHVGNPRARRPRTSMRASGSTLPLACRRPRAVSSLRSVAALPMSIWPQAIL